MEDCLKYDKSDSDSIAEYAGQLVGKTFLEVISENRGTDPEVLKAYGNKARKGGLGNLLEEVYFGYKANSNQEADFSEAGVELKATPYEYTKKGEIRAGERLVLTMISYDGPVEMEFYKSHAWEKMRRILLIYYYRNKLLNNNLLYEIGYTKLFTPPEKDLEIIKADFNFIMSKIAAGLAHELSESDTMYLGACTKGATASKSTVPQYYGDHVLARKRAFCFKNSYMTYVLTHYIVSKEKGDESIITDTKVIKEKTFGDYLIERLGAYAGKTDIYLSDKFEVNRANKGYRALLAYAMLGIKGNKAEEFVKANIEVRTIRFNKNGTNPEHFRLHDFKFKDLAESEWEDSELYEYLETTQFLLVVYHETEHGTVYKGSQLWHMSQEDIEIVRQGWESVKKKLLEGVTLTLEIRDNGDEVIHNDLPKISDNPVFHVRPHQSQTHYKFHDGSEHGKGTMANCNQLPDGQWMPGHSYWLNKEYINRQLRPDLR
ncbi:hypothetical protein BXO88_03985 [Oribacterium sp. C9]|uniref:Sau3AI family type II restriction endonuclease n=1 Tax=Oribacterium sp. C9 TaxID=1943579 RepID=UPI00098FA6FE|nr:Sau3AI family type II restriction endonuclease [Oribacterium sp. C9]OON87442.1 hypothetical protein BXO88_03985 [Oribacterium sp. C9]